MQEVKQEVDGFRKKKKQGKVKACMKKKDKKEGQEMMEK